MKKGFTNHPIVILVLIIAIFFGLFYYVNLMQMQKEKPALSNPNVIRFMPIGDSYTIGNGVKEYERWPNLLVESLKKDGVAMQLISNPSVSGHDAQDALYKELPLFEKQKPDFGTLFIGTNDSFRQRNLEQFRKDYVELLERMQNALTKRENLVVITVPKYADFPGIEGASVTVEEIENYNQIIREEASKRNISMVDLYQIETLIGEDYFISDGIHPSPKGIKVWHEAIAAVVLPLLKK